MIDEKIRLRLEQPHFTAMCRDGSAWALALKNVTHFRDAWMGGRAFWSGPNVWGETTDIKLADITGVTVRTEESLALRDEEGEEERRREITS